MEGKELYELWVEARGIVGGNARAWDSLKSFEIRAWTQLASILEKRDDETAKHYDKARELLSRALPWIDDRAAVKVEVANLLGVDL